MVTCLVSNRYLWGTYLMGTEQDGLLYSGLSAHSIYSEIRAWPAAILSLPSLGNEPEPQLQAQYW